MTTMHSLAISTGNVLAGIAFDPTIRGILAVAVGVVVLMGSVYLLLATNTGNRLGFLLALTGFFGWMAIMGLIWWIYGIGMLGQDPAWQVVEYNEADPSLASIEEVQDLDLSALPTDGSGNVDYDAIADLADEDPEAFDALVAQVEADSNGWTLLAPSDAVRNETEAAVASALPECSSCSFEISETGDYITLAAFEVGGKETRDEDANAWDRIVLRIKNTLQIKNPPHFAVLQVQKVVEQEAEVGQAPPTPVADTTQPVINVVLERDIGDRRFPSAVITVSSTIIFLLLCWVLHQRERILEEHLDEAEAVKAGV